jgi:hypothetical protein
MKLRFQKFPSDNKLQNIVTASAVHMDGFWKLDSFCNPVLTASVPRQLLFLVGEGHKFFWGTASVNPGVQTHVNSHAKQKVQN